MPPKDDDDPASTKEVVTKKQKQLLNREELNLAAIAEAFGGFLIEKKRGSSRGGGEGFGNQDTENKPKRGGARSGGRSKGNKPVTVNPGSIDPDESAVRAAEADYESDLRKGKTDPMSGSPRPDDRGAGRKSYRDLLKDMRKSALGRRKGTATSSMGGNVSDPASVRADRTSRYRAQGGGRRGDFLRRTGRLSAASAPKPPVTSTAELIKQTPKPTPAPTPPKVQPAAPTGLAARADRLLFNKILPIAKQGYAAYRATERGSKGDYLGAAIGGAVALPGIAGNVAAVVDTLRGNPEDRPPAIPRDPKQSDAGTSVATAGLPGFKKDTGKPQPDAYGPGPDFSKSDFESRQKELEKLKPKPVKLPSYEEDPSRTAPVGAFNVSPVGSASRKKVEAGIAQAIAARRAQGQPKTEPQGQSVEPPKSPTVVGVPLIPGGPGGPGGPDRTTRGPGGRKTKTGGGRFKFGAPQQPRGRIGRRQNPQ